MPWADLRRGLRGGFASPSRTRHIAGFCSVSEAARFLFLSQGTFHPADGFERGLGGPLCLDNGAYWPGDFASDADKGFIRYF
jgi:hypothetical protein